MVQSPAQHRLRHLTLSPLPQDHKLSWERLCCPTCPSPQAEHGETEMKTTISLMVYFSWTPVSHTSTTCEEKPWWALSCSSWDGLPKVTLSHIYMSLSKYCGSLSFISTISHHCCLETNTEKESGLLLGFCWQKVWKEHVQRLVPSFRQLVYTHAKDCLSLPLAWQGTGADAPSCAPPCALENSGIFTEQCWGLEVFRPVPEPLHGCDLLKHYTFLFLMVSFWYKVS